MLGKLIPFQVRFKSQSATNSSSSTPAKTSPPPPDAKPQVQQVRQDADPIKELAPKPLPSAVAGTNVLAPTKRAREEGEYEEPDFDEPTAKRARIDIQTPPMPSQIDLDQIEMEPVRDAKEEKNKEPDKRGTPEVAQVIPPLSRRVTSNVTPNVTPNVIDGDVEMKDVETEGVVTARTKEVRMRDADAEEEDDEEPIEIPEMEFSHRRDKPVPVEESGVSGIELSQFFKKLRKERGEGLPKLETGRPPLPSISRPIPKISSTESTSPLPVKALPREAEKQTSAAKIEPKLPKVTGTLPTERYSSPVEDGVAEELPSKALRANSISQGRQEKPAAAPLLPPAAATSQERQGSEKNVVAPPPKVEKPSAPPPKVEKPSAPQKKATVLDLVDDDGFELAVPDVKPKDTLVTRALGRLRNQRAVNLKIDVEKEAPEKLKYMPDEKAEKSERKKTEEPQKLVRHDSASLRRDVNKDMENSQDEPQLPRRKIDQRADSNAEILPMKKVPNKAEEEPPMKKARNLPVVDEELPTKKAPNNTPPFEIGLDDNTQVLQPRLTRTSSRTKEKAAKELSQFEDAAEVAEKLRREEADLAYARSLMPRECSLCIDEKDYDMFLKLGCGHEFCDDCLRQYVMIAINENKLPIKCPDQKCKYEIMPSDLELVIAKDVLDKFEQFSLDNLAQQKDKFSSCPTPDCQYMFFYMPGDGVDFHCPKCTKRYCLNCHVDFHVGSNCENYQKWARENGMADELFGDFVTGHNFKKCPKCHVWVEKNDGCDHMTCRCGKQFCYKCGGNYPNCKCVQAATAAAAARGRGYGAGMAGMAGMVGGYFGGGWGGGVPAARGRAGRGRVVVRARGGRGRGSGRGRGRYIIDDPMDVSSNDDDDDDRGSSDYSSDEDY